MTEHINICPRCRRHQVRNEGETCTRCLEIQFLPEICEIYGPRHLFYPQDNGTSMCACGVFNDVTKSV